MFQLATQKPIELKEFLADYNQASWLGYISKDADRVNHGQWTVRRIVERNYEGKADIYLSYNPIKGYAPRKKANVGKLALLYVDLDIGHDDNPFVDEESKKNYKQDTINSLEKNVFGLTAPPPSYICDSGRGLYLIYKIYQNEAATKQEHVNAAKRWERVNTYLTNVYEWYNADRSVSTDESRVLRVPGSLNSRSGTEVKFYKYSNAIYTLYNIERDYMSAPSNAQMEKLERVESAIGKKCNVYNARNIRRFMEKHEAEYRNICNKKKPSEKQLKYALDIARVLHIDCPNFRTAGGATRYIKKYEKSFLAEKAKRKKHSTFILNNNEKTLKMLSMRLKRIEKVLLDAPRDSYRENGLFLYRLFACEYTGDKKSAEKMTLEILHNMSNPLPEKNVLQTTKSAEKYWEANKIFKISDQKLAKKFNLTEEEWKNLIPEEVNKENKELRKARNRRYYEKKLEQAGETSKIDKIVARREEMARLLSEGKNKNEICLILEISERTFYLDVKYVSEILEKTEKQDIEILSAKNQDSLSNKGPIGPSVRPMKKNKVVINDDMVLNPFENVIMLCRNGISGEWSALLNLSLPAVINDSG